VERLTLNDPSVTTQTETSAALGPGFRCGFLGLLHADVFHQRLKEEFGAEVIATAPTVPYRVVYPGESSAVSVSSPMQLDVERLSQSRGVPRVEGSDPVGISEPMVDATIVCKNEHVGKIVELCVDRRGTQLEHTHMSNSAGTGSGDRVLLRYRLPMGEVATDFSDELKSRTSGYATFDYEESGYQQSDIVRLDVLINGQSVDALAGLIHRDKAQRSGKAWVTRLKEILPRQLFEVKIQAAVGQKVLARESISAYKKDVLANYYAMDKSRKQKLLNKQKKGKKYMKSVGSVEIPNEAFAGLLSKGFKGD
jgi:GTP-binding protein LepA